MKFPLDAKIQVIQELTNDFVECVNGKEVPESKGYSVTASREGGLVRLAAREAAYGKIVPTPLVKMAFDTRRVNQETDRNPRKNLQYWHRSDPFVSEDDEVKLNTFAKLAKVLNKMKETLGTSPEWFESYSRQLYDNVYRIIRVKEADMDIFRPQVSYLEQIVYARYRLTLDDVDNFSEEALEKKILAKDEELVGRSKYLKATQPEPEVVKTSEVQHTAPMALTQASFIDAIFGTGSLVKGGDKSVERTITITLRDNVIEKVADEPEAEIRK